MILNRNNLQNFERFVAKYQNTGHSIIESGFDSCKTSTKNTVLGVWDSKIGTKDCSCRSKIKPEILLASSIISYDTAIVNDSDFREINVRLEHLAAFHNFSSVIGLGINSVTGEDLDINLLHASQQGFLENLLQNQTSIGCRGEKSEEFFLRCGFEPSNLFITGCPALQLIGAHRREIPKKVSRVLVNGALINRLDLIESLKQENKEILIIPQTVASYNNALKVQKSYSGIEIFTPGSYRAWVNKLKSWGPHISLGTRLHGNIAALSAGIPAILMSGDVRTREIAQVAKLPFFTDIVPIASAIAKYQSTSMQDIEYQKFILRSQLIDCVNS